MGKKRHIYTRKTRLKIFSRVSNCLFYIKRKIIRIMIIMDTMVIIIMETRMDHMDIRIPILKKNSKNHKTQNNSEIFYLPKKLKTNPKPAPNPPQNNPNLQPTNPQSCTFQVIPFFKKLGDLLQSVGVVIASLVIYFYPQATIADPICTCIFAIIILFTTVPLVKGRNNIIKIAKKIQNFILYFCEKLIFF